MDQLCILICNSLAPEISHILQTGDYPDVKLKSFPAVCTGCAINDQRITELIGDDIDHYSKIVVIVSSCRAQKEKSAPLNKKVEVIRMEQCFENLLNLPTIYHLISQGNYLVSNGWLRNYQRHIREWGFEKDEAHHFFRESMRKITLLETGLPGDYGADIKSLSDFMGLPFELLPVGTNHLKTFLDSIIFKWRTEVERKIQNDKISKLSSESADYSLIFHHLQKLIDLTDETAIINEIFRLIDLLFAPEQIIFQQVKDLKSTTNYFKPDNQQIYFDPGNSFEVDIRSAGEQLGVFGIIGVKFPAFIPKYQSMTNVISQMGGLAISNARKYSEIEKTKLALELSEEHFRIMFEQSPIGIALINSENGQIKDLNTKFAQIAGRTRDEMRIIDWMQITHPDDVQADLDNMARMNAGEIPRFKMEKRYVKPNGEIVWINMTVEPIKVEDKASLFHLCMIDDITAHKGLEDKIRQSERMFKAIMLQSPSVIELYDLNGLQINVNRAYEELWGFPASRTVNKFNILKSEEVKRTGLINYVMQAYNGELVIVPDYEFDSTGTTEGHGKGRVRWLSTRIYPIKDKSNKVWNIILTHEDVTQKKQAELILSQNVQKFKNLSEAGTEMLKKKTKQDIYNYLSETLNQQYPNSVILFSEVDETESFSNLFVIKGISEKLIQKSIHFSGFDLFKKKFKLLTFHKEIFKTGKLFGFEGGLTDFSGSEFPLLASKAIGKLLGIKQIYTIGINKDGKLFATIHFFNRSNNPITDTEYIESFVRQAGIVIESKILEGLLKESEERYRLIAENTSDVIWSISLETMRFNYISPSVTNLTGFTVEEAMNQTISESLEPNDAEFVLTELPRRIAAFYGGDQSQMTETHEMRQYCKNGSLIWVEYTTLFNVNDQGLITDILGVTRNINERKIAEHQANERMKELNAFYRLAELMERKDLSIDDLCQEFVDLLPLSYQYPEVSYTKVVFKEKEFKSTNYTRNCKWVMNAPIVLFGTNSGSVEVGYTQERPEEDEGPFLKEERMLIDGITERLSRIIERIITEEQLRISEKNFKLLFENSPLGVYIANVDGAIVNGNQALLSILGSPSMELTKQINVLKFPPLLENGYANLFLKCVNENKIFIAEMPYTTYWGKQLYLSSYLVPLANSSGKVEQVYTLMEDITKRKLDEKELIENEIKLKELVATKDKFFSIIAHDLRSPFASIVGFSELMANGDSGFSIDDYRMYSHSLHKTALSTFNLLENLLEWSRFQRGAITFNPKPIVLKEFFENCSESISEMATKKSIQLDIDFLPTQVIMADNDMLHSVVRNLVTNAIKFTNNGGTVNVKVSKTDLGEILFSIQDSGIGMDSERINKLFRIDTNVSRTGTDGEPSSGLGLILCNEFVEMHGGKIWVESQEGKGSTFFFTIPNV